MAFLIGKKPLYPHLYEKKYNDFLLRLIRNLKSKVIRVIKDSLGELKKLRFDDFIDDIELFIANLKRDFNYDLFAIYSFLGTLSKSIGSFTMRSSYKAIGGLLELGVDRNLGVNIFSGNDDLERLTRSWSISNSRLIKSISDNQLDRVAEIVQSGYRSGLSIKDVTSQIYKSFDVTLSKARLLARDQTSKLNSDVTRYGYIQAGITLYIWSGADDEKQRTSHRVLNGKICSIYDDTIYKNKQNGKWLKRSSISAIQLAPGKDYRCRCVMRAVVEF